MKEETLKPTEPQPPPQAGQREITALVIADLVQRHQDGCAKYGRPLESFNGRDPLKDAYQEALDLCQYLRQLIEERDSAK